MKTFLLLGGCTGFTLTFAGSLHAGNAPAFALRDGSIGCLVGALLLRGLHAVYSASIRSHLIARAAAEKSPSAEPSN